MIGIMGRKKIAGRALSFGEKLTTRTAPEIVEAVDHLHAEMKASGVRFRDKKVSKEAILSAIVLYFIENEPETDRVKLVKQWVKRYEEVLGDRPTEPPRDGPPTVKLEAPPSLKGGPKSTGPKRRPS